MKSFSSTEPLVFDISGNELRIHWNIEKIEKISELDSEITYTWVANEAVCNTFDDRDTIISKIIASCYPLTSEIAIINNKENKPSEYDIYQSFRILAKSLADTWLNSKQG